MSAQIIDGKAIALEVRAGVAEKVKSLKEVKSWQLSKSEI